MIAASLKREFQCPKALRRLRKIIYLPPFGPLRKRRPTDQRTTADTGTHRRAFTISPSVRTEFA